MGLDPTPPRSRNPTPPSTPARVSHYRNRGLARDGQCLITGLQSETTSRLEVTHIFPKAHDDEVNLLRCHIHIRLLSQWKSKGYPSKITDRANDAAVGGPLKIDSIQNVITLRGDLSNAWVNYEFGVDPKVGSITRHELLPGV